MRTMVLIMAMCAACAGASGEGAAVQPVAEPGGVTVTPRDTAGQLAVSWTADPAAVRYQVLQAQGGAAPALVATVFDSSGGSPSTSWIAEGLAAGVTYCYSVVSAFSDGTTSDPSSASCSTAVGTPPAGTAHRRNVPLVLRWINPTNTWASLDVGARSLSIGGLNQGQGATSIDVPFEVGETIQGAEVWRFSDGTAGAKAALLALAAGNDIIISAGTDTLDSAATARAMYSIPAAAGAHTMAAGERLRLVLFAETSAGYTIDSVNLLYSPAQ